MSPHPVLQIKILGVAFLLEAAFLSYVSPNWLDLLAPLVRLSAMVATG